ncbi:MAG: molybdate ABC transporter substrate-binding protein [Candidatus Acidiferrales bacterium]
MRSHEKEGLKSRRLFNWGLLVLFCGSLAAISAARIAAVERSSAITVSAAISLKDALDEIGRLYQARRPGAKVAFNYGGSGTLQRQIEQGAPVDIFFSAAETQMDGLAAQGLIATETRRDIVGNTLVLIVPATTRMLNDFPDLTRLYVSVIALGEPGTVPAGMYARQTLEHMGLFAAVEKKIVYAKDVRAVLTYVETGNADAGFVYRTDALSSPKVRVVATAAADSHDPIVYPAAVLKNSKNAGAAREFVDFLQGSEARAAFEKYGFTPAEKSAVKN